MLEGSPAAKKLTIDELVLAELKGKHDAARRYDTILWRVRGGYLAVLYGSLLLVTGKEGGIATLMTNPGLVRAALVIVVVLSLTVAVIDLGFRFRQLKVVTACNRLSDVAFRLATGREVPEDELLPLLYIAGESAIPVGWSRRVRATVLIVALYLVSPLLAFAAFIVIGP